MTIEMVLNIVNPEYRVRPYRISLSLHFVSRLPAEVLKKRRNRKRKLRVQCSSDEQNLSTY